MYCFTRACVTMPTDPIQKVFYLQNAEEQIIQFPNIGKLLSGPFVGYADMEYFLVQHIKKK